MATSMDVMKLHRQGSGTLTVTICTPASRLTGHGHHGHHGRPMGCWHVGCERHGKVTALWKAMTWNSAFEDMFSGVPLMIPVLASKIKPTHQVQQRAQPCTTMRILSRGCLVTYGGIWRFPEMRVVHCEAPCLQCFVMLFDKIWLCIFCCSWCSRCFPCSTFFLLHFFVPWYHLVL